MGQEGSAPWDLRSQEWLDAETELFAFLNGVGATEAAIGLMVLIRPIPTGSRRDFDEWLRPQVQHDLPWMTAIQGDRDGEQKGYALPVTDRSVDDLTFLFVPIHSLLVTWWLIATWRTRQLAEAASSHAASGRAVAAAACVRPLVETAAAVWSDGQAVARAWSELKATGLPMNDPDADGRRVAILSGLAEALYGSKFDGHAPELKRTWGIYERTNVLTQVERLAKLAPIDLQGDYEWLCNTVHPSLGNSLVFATQAVMHASGTHTMQVFSAAPWRMEPLPGAVRETLIEDALAEAASWSLRALRRMFDHTLRIVDDVALTTDCPSACREPYWRKLVRPAPYDPCPCRSGKKGKWCQHRWGSKAPDLPPPF